MNMANPYFQFQRFTVYHDKCAMKVGTDGVLVGAWANIDNANRILDIGTGTGLIALMAAQRTEATIDAIDVDDDACLQATENVQRSPFANRINILHTGLEDFLPGQQGGYDRIVTNPPYFVDSLKCPNDKRNLARHTDTLSLDSLLTHGKRLLNPEGQLALILPFDQLNRLKALSQEKDLYLHRLTEVVPVEGGNPKRLLAELSPMPTLHPVYDRLVIENKDHHYTEPFVKLIREFYIRWQ